MFNSMPESGQRDSVVESGEEVDVRGSEREPTDDKKGKGVFVRISAGAKEILENAAKGEITYGRVIEALLFYLGMQDPDLQDKILKGINITPVKEIEDVLAQLHRAQHAFENGRFYYAVKMYWEIAAKLEAEKKKGRDISEELLEVCNYRLGHSLIRLSYDLRREALSYDRSGKDSGEDRHAKLYFIALDALNKALQYLEKVGENADTLTRLIKHYNMACCHSLKAQYLVESKLEPTSTKWEALRDAKKDLALTQKAWKSMGEDWRKNDGAYAEVDHEADQALKELMRIYPLPATASDTSDFKLSSDLTSEGLWVVEMAVDDSDLIFLHSDKNRWKPRFDEWSAAALRGDNSIAKPYRDLLSKLT